MADKKPKSQNKANNSVQKTQEKAQILSDRKPCDKRRLAIIIVAVIAVLAILAGSVYGVWYAIYGTRFDYLTGNIGKYITLAEGDYSGYELNVTVPEPTQLDVDERILQTLAKNKSKTPLNNGFYVVPTAPIANGWKLKIWYRGYTLDEDGKKIDIDGTCNFTSAEASELEIGSGTFVSGFEISLIGKYLSECSKFATAVSGTVLDTDIIVVNMNAMYPDGSSEQYTGKRIDLSDEDLEEVYGEGFREAIAGVQIGSTLDDVLIAEMENGTAVYTDIKVVSAVRPTIAYTSGTYSNGERVTVEYTVTPSDGESKAQRITFVLSEQVIGGNFGGALREILYSLLGGGEVGDTVSVSEEDSSGTVYSNPRVISVEKREDKPITVDAHFPYDYSEKSLQGKTVKFDVYVDSAIVYEAPELTDEFISDTLKLTADDLSAYSGDTLTEKYRGMVRAELMSEYQAKLESQADELVWARLVERVVYSDKKLPKGELRAIVNEYKQGFKEYCELYKGQYETTSAAAMDYFGIGDGSKWEEYVRSVAVQSIVEKMIFYYIAREENLLPVGDEFDTLYNEKVEHLLEDYLVSKKCDRANYETEEAYLAAVADYRAQMLELYTVESIKETVYYESAMPKIRALATLVKP